MEIISFKKNKLYLLDQRKIPQKTEYVICKNEKDVFNAIKNMVVRGAPAIGITACYGIALSKNPLKTCEYLKKSRPTAVDLFNAIEYMKKGLKNGKEKIKLAKDWHNIIKEKTEEISENGAKLITNGYTVLVHCNTGPLATGAYGTALGAVIKAKKQGKKFFVYVDETRPRFQGAITSWELKKAKIPHKIIVDSEAGFIMHLGKIDCVLVGADRIVKNGDFANKIGTYSLSVLAKENKIPFYVFAPLSTFDFKTKDGVKIKIEERDEKEILEILRKRIYPKNAKALNLAFDVTPSKYVSKYITEYGVHKKIKEIEKIWKNIQE